MTENEKYLDYLDMLRKPFQKLCRLRFLQPDGSTAFMLDNRVRGEGAGAFISDGSITHNWQNGRRTNATVTIDNVDGAYDYSFTTIWFGQEIALDEGMVLSDGVTEFYIQQGVFLIETPSESVRPGQRTVSYSLVDKVAALDGTLGGNLEGTHQVAVGTNIFTPIASILAEDKGNGYPIDNVTPVFTEFYNGKTQTLPDGTVVNMTDAPYTLTIDGTDGTVWGVVSGLAGMVNGWVGYDETGALRIDPSQDDILDSDKPVLWDFSTDEAELLGMTYSVKNTEVYNDYIVIGEALTDGTQPCGRAEVLDPRSPVDIHAIGRKTIRVSQTGFGTNQQCQDYAAWMLKRSAVLQRAVSISCSQILHIHGNDLVTITRTDKQGSPKERHLIQGFSRPLASTGEMTINAVSVNDFPVTTIAYVGMISFVPSQVGGLAYTGSAQSPTWNDYMPNQLSIGGQTSATNVGTYTATFTPIGGYVWWDGTNTPKNATWTITKMPIAIPTATGTYAYTGASQTLVFVGYDSSTMSKSGTQSATNAGSYLAKISLQNTSNYMWSDGTTATKNYNWAIDKRTITPPQVIGTYTYTGSAQTVAFSGYDSSTMSKSGTQTATNAGGYTATISLQDTANNMWTGGSSAAKNYGWSIQKATAAYTAPTPKSLTYTGSSQALLNAGSTSNGTIQYSENNSSWSTTIPSKTNAGTYTVYWRLVADANHKDVPSTAITVTLAKANPTYTAPTARSLTYNGSAQALLNAGSTSHGTISYSENASSWSSSIPQKTNAGSYTVYWRLVGDANHNSIGATAISVTLAKANPATPTLSKSSISFSEIDTNSFTVTRSGDGAISATSSDTSVATTNVSGNTVTVTAAGKIGSATITVTVAAGTNYNAYTGTGAQCTVTAAINTTYCLTFTKTGSDFTLRVAGSTKTWNGTIEWSNGTSLWAKFNGDTTLTSNSGKLYLRGKYNTRYTHSAIRNELVLSGSAISCSGNVETLLDYQTVMNGSHPSMDAYCFYSLFRSCTSLVSAPTIPATSLSPYCYMYMFYGCTSLASAPALPATDLSNANNCYDGMFWGCSSLTTSPALPATTLSKECYITMFYQCAALSTIANLPATTLKENCYRFMYGQCPSVKLSTSSGTGYSYSYRVPKSGTGTTATGATEYMFTGTGGSFTGTPSINTTYYINNQPVG